MFNQVAMILLAVLPILAVLYLMIGRKWGGSNAGLAGWGAAMAVAVLAFGADFQLLWVAFGKGFFLALYVLYIIWMALLLYNVTNDAGAIEAIGQELPLMTADRGGQALLLAWVFASFLQGASGFGVPAAVVAPLLVGLGFSPTIAVVVALIGHAWAVTYGSLGSSFLALIAASGISGESIEGPVALFLGLCCFLCGLFVLWSAGGREALKQRWPALVATGGVMFAGQYVIASWGFWSLASFGASLLGLVVMVTLFQLGNRGNANFNRSLLAWGFWPYLIMTVIILLGKTILEGPLSFVIVQLPFPAVETSLGFATPAENGRSINLFGHPGALLLYSSALVFLWYKWRGNLPTAKGPLNGSLIVSRTVKKSVKSTISIIALVAMGTTMQHAGMTQLLADTLSTTGGLFALLSPFIGALGAFVTGSNTNSNVVFADLQRQTALVLQLSVPYILAAQTAGGAIGSAFAPAKVIVGVSTVEGADEGKVLQLATTYGLAIIIVVGLLSLLVTSLSGA
ncbi:MAG: L-lactate permease [Ardenticatenaceae bacterium]|nr:L-lactate permease [Ardenticatenaceae bacterium]